jgi:hypothetical protein
MDYQRNAKYFKKPSYGFPIGLIIVGIVVCLIARTFGMGAAAWIIAIVLIGIGVLLIANAGKGRPTDAEMDGLVAQPENLAAMALEKHGINPDDAQAFEPVIWGGYYKPAEAGIMGADSGVIDEQKLVSQTMDMLSNVIKNADDVSSQAAEVTGKAFLQIMKGKDGIVRSSLSWWGIWLFSKTEMYTFMLIQSLTKEWRQVSGEEYPYQEIRKVTFEDVSGYKVARFQMVDGKVETCIIRDEAAQSALNALRQEIRDRRV